MTDRGEVIFLGGAQHSGVEVVADLLGHHSLLARVPYQARFHSDDRGMPALLGGRLGLADFVARLRETWWNESWEESGVERFERNHAAPVLVEAYGGLR